jgi:polyhydroxyalkanoate synthesis regulator phasin
MPKPALSSESTSSEGSLLILRHFLQKLGGDDGKVDPDIATKLIDSMAQAGTITVATAKELTSELGKEAVKQGADGTKQIVVHLATTLIDRFLKKEEKKELGPKDHVLTAGSPVVVNVDQSNACGRSQPPKPCTPPAPQHPPKHGPGLDCKAPTK